MEAQGPLPPGAGRRYFTLCTTQNSNWSTLGTVTVLLDSQLHVPAPPMCLYHQLTDYTRKQIQANSESGAKQYEGQNWTGKGFLTVWFHKLSQCRTSWMQNSPHQHEWDEMQSQNWISGGPTGSRSVQPAVEQWCLSKLWWNLSHSYLCNIKGRHLGSKEAL